LVGAIAVATAIGGFLQRTDNDDVRTTELGPLASTAPTSTATLGRQLIAYIVDTESDKLRLQSEIDYANEVSAGRGPLLEATFVVADVDDAPQEIEAMIAAEGFTEQFSHTSVEIVDLRTGR
jgi:hypothetical protein